MLELQLARVLATFQSVVLLVTLDYIALIILIYSLMFCNKTKKIYF